MVANSQRLRCHFQTYANTNWQYVDVTQALAGTTQVMTVKMFTPPDYKNITDTRANFTNYVPASYYKYQDK